MLNHVGYQEETSIRGTGEGFSRRLYAAAGPEPAPTRPLWCQLFGVTAAAVGTQWSWEEIVSIAEMMVARIWGVLQSVTR
jgi:hypothetical protein